MRQLWVAHVRIPPDLVRLLRADQLEGDCAHRGHRRELNETFRLAVWQLAGNARDGLEPRNEQAESSVCAGLFRHARIFAAAPDGPSHGTVRRAHTFSSKRSTAGSPRDAPKLITPAANTFAPAGVS